MHVCSQEGIVPIFFGKLGLKDWQSSIAMSFHLNLSTERQGSERNISSNDLDEGVPRAMSIIEETRCKCVLTVSARVFRRIAQSLATSHMLLENDRLRYHCVQDYSTPWELWENKTGRGKLLLAKTPQHPAKTNFWHEAIPEFAADLGNVAREKLLTTGPLRD
jgi:hypothetical protein